MPSTDILYRKPKRLFSAALPTGAPWGRLDEYDKYVASDKDANGAPKDVGNDAGWPNGFCILRVADLPLAEALAIIAPKVVDDVLVHRHTKAMKGTVPWGQIKNLDPAGYNLNRIINTTRTAFLALLEDT